ncbi:hypothetical protein [Halomonas heilongjiangensis]|uniref:Lipoprotein n=1 Tax=Halomonas heilongjiangensis TaxID=1387883 RepID=A0A2N7TPP7_9GAMM|nr:hypothetical protein [Halomonas heilongjiangensis]PMR70181.1 hypothetical protein C1H66_07585 [Halomonas heilongjiangensis]PXX87533.1 hypothetical protein CR158_17110 [Halomonas heilongjiangensis]
MFRSPTVLSFRLPRHIWLAAIVVTLLLAGCVAPKPGADLPPFGDSVRHTKALQTYEPGDEVPPLHGAKAAEAMQGYRQPTGGGQAPTSSLP